MAYAVKSKVIWLTDKGFVDTTRVREVETGRQTAAQYEYILEGDCRSHHLTVKREHVSLTMALHAVAYYLQDEPGGEWSPAPVPFEFIKMLQKVTSHADRV